MKADKTLLKALLYQETPDMPDALACYLERQGFKVTVDENENVLGIKGKPQGAPLLIAHTDTVMKKPPRSVICHHDWIIALDELGKQDRLGADDRAGCAAILQIAPHLKDCTALFCAFEEIGGIGASRADLEPLQGACIALELDRRMQDKENSDAIWISNSATMASGECKHDLKSIFHKHGYKYGEGTFTDVGELKLRGLRPSAFNLTIGYTREHTANEALFIPSYERALDCALEISRACIGKEYPHKPAYPDFVYTPIYAPYYDPHLEANPKRLTRREKKRLRRLQYQTAYYEDIMHHETYGPPSNVRLNTVDEVDRCEGCGGSNGSCTYQGMILCPDCLAVWMR